MYPRKKLALVSVLLVVSAAFATSSCRSPNSVAAPGGTATGPGPAPVNVARVSTGNITVTTTYSATVQPGEQVNVGPGVSGQIEKITVDVGSQVVKGQTLAQLNHANLDIQLKQAQASLQDAQNRLAILQGTAAETEGGLTPLALARAQLQQLLNPSATDLQSAVSAVTIAQTSLDSASTKLRQLLNPSASAQAAVRSSVAAAQAALDAANNKLNVLLNPPASSQAAAQVTVLTAQGALDKASADLNTAIAGGNAVTIALAQDTLRTAQASLTAATAKQVELVSPDVNAVALARNDVRTAQATLDTAVARANDLANPDPNVVALAQNDVRTAQANFDTASARLAAMKNPSATTIAGAQAAVTNAQQALSSAQTQVGQAQAQVDLVKWQIAQTSVVAPFDGTIAQRLLAAGATASAQSPVFTIVSKSMYVSFSVEEAAVSGIAVGQKVTVSSPGVFDRALELPITVIAPTANALARTFEARIAITGSASGLRPGMSARVTVPTIREGVLLVPRAALVQQTGQYVVWVVTESAASPRQVTVGLMDGRSVEVRSGIKADEQVVTSPQGQLSDGVKVTVRQPGTAPAGAGAPGAPRPGAR